MNEYNIKVAALRVDTIILFIIQLEVNMKRMRSNQMQTPIKKWQQMSPMEESLVFVESDLSSA